MTTTPFAVAKRSEPTRIQLDRADYFELQALALKLELARHNLLSAKTAFEAAQASVLAKATGHGVQPGQSFYLDDATHSVLVGEMPDGQTA